MKLETSRTKWQRKNKHSGKIPYQTFCGDMYMNLKPSGHVSKKILTSETWVDANWMVPKYRCEAFWMAPWFCWIHPNNTSMHDLTTKNRLGHTLQKKMSWWMRLPHGHRQLTRFSQLKWMEFQLRRQFLWFEKTLIYSDLSHDTVDGSENSALPSWGW